MITEAEIKKLYNSANWRTKTQPAVLAANPICQRVVDGIQCTKPSAIVHHLIDPRNAPQLFLNWSNLCACCSEHHPGGLPGTNDTYVWVHTIGPLSAVYLHSGGWPSWRAEFQQRTPAQRELAEKIQAQGAKFSSVGENAIDAALAEEI